MEGTVFNIQRFCVNDGPGVRTTVFLKGCPLRCAWCHNPESHRREPEILFSPEKCIRCGACAAACERHSLADGVHAFDRGGCAGCGRCAEKCCAGALERCGRIMTADEVLAAVERDGPFYADGGGMTLSGGEPTFQPEFCIALAEGAKARGLHVAIETCGACSRETILALAEWTDLFLYDIKSLDDGVHRQYTGASNRRSLDNLTALSKAGAQIILRCPIIPGVNLTDGHFSQVAALAETVGAREVQFQPYHPLGVEKSRRLGRKAAYEDTGFLDRAAVEALAQKAQALTEVRLTVQ